MGFNDNNTGTKLRTVSTKLPAESRGRNRAYGALQRGSAFISDGELAEAALGSRVILGPSAGRQGMTIAE